jgi:hypothetical protein
MMPPIPMLNSPAAVFREMMKAKLSKSAANQDNDDDDSQESQPRVEIAFKGPAVVPSPKIVVPVEISPVTSTAAASKQEAIPDQISYRSAP